MTSTAQTMQDGLLTLVLELGEPLESLEVFFEDVIAVHVNPGAPVTLEELLNDPAYQLSYSYDPATQEPSVEIPEALSNMCPPGDQSFSFYGCVHTHSVAKREVVDDTAAYMVGTGGVAYFMDVILSGGMATISAVELGTDFEVAASARSMCALSGADMLGAAVDLPHGPAIHSGVEPGEERSADQSGTPVGRQLDRRYLLSLLSSAGLCSVQRQSRRWPASTPTPRGVDGQEHGRDIGRHVRCRRSGRARIRAGHFPGARQFLGDRPGRHRS